MEQNEQKVYCSKIDCPFWCEHNPIGIPPIPLLFSSDTQPQKYHVELPEYFGDKCKLRIRKWVEEMLG